MIKKASLREQTPPCDLIGTLLEWASCEASMPVHIRLFLTLPLALITLLVLRSGLAYAEWVEVTADDLVTSYTGTMTIRHTGNLVRM